MKTRTVIVADAGEWSDADLVVAVSTLVGLAFFVGLVVGAIAACGVVVWGAP